MQSRNSADFNASKISDEEIKQLADSTSFTEEQLRKLFEVSNQYTKEELIRLVLCAYIPSPKTVVHVDQKHDVIYYTTKINLNEPAKATEEDSPVKIISEGYTPPPQNDSDVKMHTFPLSDGSLKYDRNRICFFMEVIWMNWELLRANLTSPAWNPNQHLKKICNNFKHPCV